MEALRNAAYFGGSGTAGPLLVLAGWAVAVAAVALVAAALARARRPGTPPPAAPG